MYQVMIVDDEDYIRDLLVKNIQESSLEVEVAAAGDGVEALKIALAARPDIVITDISMPFMNGLELIKELQKAGINSKNAVISGCDEFDYARQAITLGVKDYLLKPFLPKELQDVIRKMVQELDNQKTLQQNMSLLREQALSRAKIAREKAVKELLEGRSFREEDLGFKGGYCLTGIIRFVGSDWSFDNQESVEEILMLIKDGYFPENMELYAVSLDGRQLVAVWSGSGESEAVFLQKVKHGIEKIHTSFKKYYDITLTCALGRTYRKNADLAQSYREALAVWRGTLEAGNPILLYGNDSDGKEEANASNQIRDLKMQIRLSVRTGQEQDACSQLQNLMKSYASLANKKNDYISVSVRELIYVIQSDMEAAGCSRGEAEWASDIQNHIRHSSLMEIKEMLEGYIKACCQAVSEHSEETKAGAAVKQIKLLIDNNIKNPDMDLEWVAGQVHFSVSYVRQIFKQHMGECFGEYLIRKRMEHAGMLLQKTNLRIQEIAMECGYDNQRYFASSFKKYYDCTPTEFKKAVLEERLY